MSCGHCVHAVSGELHKLPGVTAVDVDLDTGRVSVTTSGEALDAAAIRAAIDDAGYELVA
jgi:copper chaperone